MKPFLRLIWILILGCSVFARQDPPPEPKPKLTRDQLAAAEALLGLSFTDSERDLMLEDLSDSLADYAALHAADIPNAIPPSLIFNPLPLGFQETTDHRPAVFAIPGAVALPARFEDLAYYSVAQLSGLIRSRQVTSVALTKLFLDRLKKYDQNLHCVITLTEDSALAQAARADRELAEGHYRGPLHGIPYGAKDLLAFKGYKTTWGAQPYKDQVIDDTATVIEKLEKAGAVLVAKLSLGALAWGDVWYGAMTRNPWNPEEGSSGSSAGSASAVSAGLVPFAIGTETYGSIVSPATRCGVTGLRPTYGRVSRAGAMALSWSMDKIGPIARSVEDCAIVFDAIRGPDGKDQHVIDAPFAYDHNRTVMGMRIGYLKDAFEADYRDKERDQKALEVLRGLGAELVPIALPARNDGALILVLQAEAAAAFDQLTQSGRDDLLVRQVRQAWPNVFRAAQTIPAVAYIQSSRLRFQLIQDMEKLMKTIDVYVSPTFGGGNLLVTNLTGHPCVVVPNGFRDEERKSPASITFMGRLFDEATVLTVAKRYQEATGFHNAHPPLFP